MSKKSDLTPAAGLVRPAAAPLPSKDTGSHATDSQGVRTVDSEDVKTHGLNPKNEKKPSKTRPRFSKSTDDSPSTRVNHFRQVALTLPFWEKLHPSPNVFIPCFGMMFHFLATMNDTVCAERPFGDNGTVIDWIPQVSVIVFSILGYIQVFRAQAISGNLDNQTLHLLTQFCDKFPLNTIVIPGPLVPFFRSLSISSPGFGNFQDVTPFIPRLSATEQRFYNLEYQLPANAGTFEGISMLLPNIILMVDQFRHLMTHLLTPSATGNNLYSRWTQLSSIFGSTRPTDAGASQAAYDNLLKSVGFWHRPTASNGLMSRYASFLTTAVTDFPIIPAYSPDHAERAAVTAGANRTPYRPASWQVTNDPADFLQLGKSTGWFGIFLKGMSSFNQYWKGNTSLADLVPTSSTAGQIIFHDAEVTALAPAGMFSNHNLNNATHELVFNTHASSVCPFIADEDLHDAQAAQVHITSVHTFASDRQIGEDNVTRFGEFWQTTPDILTTPQRNLTKDYQNMITSPVFFTDI